MNRTSAQLKQLSRKTLNGKYGTPMAACLLLALISLMLYMLSTVLFSGISTSSMVMSQTFTIVISLIVSIFSAGLFKLHLNLCRNQAYSVGDLVYAFSHHPDRMIISAFIQSIPGFIVEIPAFVYLTWLYQNPESTSRLSPSVILLVSSVLGGIVSMIVKLLFFMSIPLLLDDPQLGAIDSLKESLQLMKGYKGRLFYIQLSFIGLVLLSVFSCYIGLLWIAPYIITTEVYVYLNIKGEIE